MNETYGGKLWGKYGFKDASNPSINWFSRDYVGIDEEVMLSMIENYRVGLIQYLFMQNEYSRTAIQRAGFEDESYS